MTQVIIIRQQNVPNPRPSRGQIEGWIEPECRGREIPTKRKGKEIYGSHNEGKGKGE